MEVKICGITNYKDALLCQDYGADAIGFIFYSKSKRYITPAKAASIINRLSPFIVKVGIFVNAKLSFVNETAELARINIVQLHGDEDENYYAGINLPVIKSFRIKDNFDFREVYKYKKVGYLLDSYSDNSYGGTGKKFNWDLIPGYLKDKIILSGGVSEKNIEYIFHSINPAAVDLSSSLESSPGKKDEKKVKAFFKKVNKLRYLC